MNVRRRILLLCGNKELADQLRPVLAECSEILGLDDLSEGSGDNVTEIFRKDKETDYNFVVIAAPLANGYGLEAAKHIASVHGTNVMFICSQKNVDEVYNRIGKYGVFVCARPVTKSGILQNLRFMISSAEKLENLEKDKKELEEKISDLKLINRAKCTLVRYLSITEEEAHRQMQKQAMDQRSPLVDVAVSILKKYEYI